jgi:peptidoglycan/LPS O-acetylase OafA/YrhL
MTAPGPALTGREPVQTGSGAFVPADAMSALTGVRLPLALWIVAHHLSGPGRMLDPLTRAVPPIAALLESAWVALTAFFAISGFVLTRRYLTTIWTRGHILTYVAARFGRIYPLYAFSLLLIAPIVIEHIRQDELGSPVQNTGLVLNYVLLLQGWFRPSVNWNTPAWSLSCEVFFYALAPLILCVARVATWPRVVATAGVACTAPIICRLTMEAPIPKALLYFGDFLIGVAAALLFERLQLTSGGRRRLGPWLYGAAVVGGTALLFSRDAIPSFLLFDTGVRLVSVLLVVGLACGGGWLVRMLSSQAVLAGGRASYAIYILHIPILWWYARSPLYRDLPSVHAGLLYVAIVVLVSLLISRTYEEPANTVVRAWCARWQQRVEPGTTHTVNPSISQIVGHRGP